MIWSVSPTQLGSGAFDPVPAEPPVAVEEDRFFWDGVKEGRLSCASARSANGYSTRRRPCAPHADRSSGQPSRCQAAARCTVGSCRATRPSPMKLPASSP